MNAGIISQAVTVLIFDAAPQFFAPLVSIHTPSNAFNGLVHPAYFLGGARRLSILGEIPLRYWAALVFPIAVVTLSGEGPVPDNHSPACSRLKILPPPESKCGTVIESAGFSSNTMCSITSSPGCFYVILPSPWFQLADSLVNPASFNTYSIFLSERMPNSQFA